MFSPIVGFAIGAFSALTATQQAAQKRPPDRGPLPPAIQACIAYRQAIQRADVRWGSWSPANSVPDGEYGRRSLLAGDDVIEFDYGGPDGRTAIDGNTGQILYQPSRRLIRSDYVAQYQLPDPFVTVLPGGAIAAELPSVRLVGLFPTDGNEYRRKGGLEEIFLTYPAQDDSAGRYAERTEGNLVEVALKLESGTQVYWWIDPQRGHNVVRSELLEPGRVPRYAVCELVQFGDIWYPAQVQYFAGARTDPLKTVGLHSAALNEPDLPERLTLKELDIEPGLVVSDCTRPVHDPLRSGSWSGEEVVTATEWDERVRRGEVDYGPIGKANLAAVEYDETGKLPAEPIELTPELARIAPHHMVLVLATRPASRPAEHPWTLYTREIIRIAQLDHEQTQKAWLICKDARERGDAVAARFRKPLDALNGRARELRESAEPNIAERLIAIERERYELLRPLDTVFSEQLRARLFRLLTRAQAESHRSELEAVPQPVWIP